MHIYTSVLCVQVSSKVDCDTNKLIHALTSAYNKVIWLLKLVNIVECSKCCVELHV